MTRENEQAGCEPGVILIPCAPSGRVGCEIVRRAVELVAAGTPEAMVAAPDQCPAQGKRFIVAVDASRACRASAALENRGTRASLVISAPEVLARAGLVRPGMDLRSNIEQLSRAVSEAIQESLREVLEEARERRRYREEMEPILHRFQGLWTALEALPPPPDGVPSEEERRRVELLGRRCRNLFTKFDEVVPPTQWAEPHDLFQDALLCMAYACEGWVSGEAARWEQNLEKARVQVHPLMRRLA